MIPPWLTNPKARATEPDVLDIDAPSPEADNFPEEEVADYGDGSPDETSPVYTPPDATEDQAFEDTTTPVPVDPDAERALGG